LENELVHAFNIINLRTLQLRNCPSSLELFGSIINRDITVKLKSFELAIDFDNVHHYGASKEMYTEVVFRFLASFQGLEDLFYGQKLGVLAQLEIWVPGSPAPFMVSTDQSWDASTSALVSSEIYDGEIYDQRPNASTRPGDAKWFSTQESFIPVSRLISPEAPPVRVVGRIEPKDFFKSQSGNAVIVDFGQNFAGRVCVRKVQKALGASITFRHAEVIQDGEIVRGPLRTAKARDILICDGRETLDWHPNHTFHGFRYVEITGWSPEHRDCPLTKSSIVAEVLHTDMSRTGWFSCSNEDVNRLHENLLWSMKSNFLSVPTECPSRDERMGWTGDLNIFAPTANFLYDTAGMLRNWLDDLYLDQMEESTHWRQGVVPLFIPNSLLRKDDGGHGWDPMPNAV
jgi:alpha-L-rhamnosidase